MKTNVDARGLLCPEPVLLTKKALERTGQGLVEILVDNNGAKENISRLAAALGWSISIETSGGDFLLKLQK